MELIVMRHGKAADSHPDGDHSRTLTPKGQRQAQRQARRLAAIGLLPDIVLCSPLARARQTAEAFCQTAGIPGPVIQGWLSCGMSPEAAMRELGGFSEFERVALVGHEPDLSMFIASIIGSSATSIHMRTGCMAWLRVSPPARRGTLEMLLPAKSGSLEQQEP